jgi:hypothetical protein
MEALIRQKIVDDCKKLYGEDYIKINSQRLGLFHRLGEIAYEATRGHQELSEGLYDVFMMHAGGIITIIQNPVKIMENQFKEYKDLPLINYGSPIIIKPEIAKLLFRLKSDIIDFVEKYHL